MSKTASKPAQGLISRTFLSNLACAPENARFGDTSDVTTLAASIEAFGDLLEPLKVYEEAGAALVWDGGRRLRALQLLASEKRLPDALQAEGVPVIVTSKGDAKLKSVATFIREDQHPADKFMTYNDLFSDGARSVEEVAAMCGVDSRTVSQLLRFRVLAPEVLQAFKAGLFSLDVAFAFTITDQKERQVSVLNKAKTLRGDIQPWAVKNALQETAVRATDTWAMFVGRDAYVAAGGTFLVDLFSRGEADEQFADGALLNQLAQKKLADLTDSLKAEGWGKVIFKEDSYGWAGGFRRMTPEGDAEKGKGKKGKAWTAEQLANGVAFIIKDYREVKVERGWCPEGKSAGAAAKALTPAQAQPELYGFGHAGHATLTAVATQATRVALYRNPKAAYDAMLSHMAWIATRAKEPHSMSWGSSSDTASCLEPRQQSGGPFVAHAGVEGADELAEALKGWAEFLPTTRVAFCEAVASLDPTKKAELLALCFAWSLDATEARWDYRRPDRQAHLGWIAKTAGVDVVAAWKPSVDFLKGGSKDALLKAIGEAGGAEGMAGAKKGELVNYVANLAETKGWRPKMLRELTNVSGQAEAEALAAREAQRAEARAKLQEAGEDGDDTEDDDAIYDVGDDAGDDA